MAETYRCWYCGLKIEEGEQVWMVAGYLKCEACRAEDLRRAAEVRMAEQVQMAPVGGWVYRTGGRVGPCQCACNGGGFCGGCGHAGCGGRR